MKKLFLFIVLISFYSCDRNKLSNDEKAIIATIHYLEEINFLNGTTFPRLEPPPPLPPPGFIYDSIDFKSHIKNETSYRERIKKFYIQRLNTPIVDSSFIILSVNDSLFSNYNWAHLQQENENNYQVFIDHLKSNNIKSIKLDADRINSNLNLKYKIKPISEFDENFSDLFYTMYPFLYGGHIRFSKFYHNSNYGMIMFEYWSCEMDCGVGYLSLLEYNKDWEVVKLERQWIN